MKNALSIAVLVSALAAIAQAGTPAAAAEAKQWRTVSERTVTGFAFPESVAYDPAAKVLYVSQFGSELKPAEKDGKGRIGKVALDGKVLEERFLPAHGETLHKPKGIWVKGNRLWVTDIDAVWVFDLKTREGAKLELPGIQFANDPALLGNALYVSDNRSDQLFKVEPADFLSASVDPKITKVFSGKGIDPNGLFPARDGSLLMVGFKSDKEARGIYALGKGGAIKTLAKDVGRLDGLYQMPDGSLLITNWNTGSLVRWSADGSVQTLASGFKGPADFCVVPKGKGLLVVVPDLAKSELRLVEIAR